MRLRFNLCIWLVVFLLNIRDQVFWARVIIDSNPEEYRRQIESADRAAEATS